MPLLSIKDERRSVDSCASLAAVRGSESANTHALAKAASHFASTSSLWSTGSVAASCPLPAQAKDAAALISINLSLSDDAADTWV